MPSWLGRPWEGENEGATLIVKENERYGMQVIQNHIVEFELDRASCAKIVGISYSLLRFTEISKQA